MQSLAVALGAILRKTERANQKLVLGLFARPFERWLGLIGFVLFQLPPEVHCPALGRSCTSDLELF